MSSNQQGHSQQAPAASKSGTLTIVGSGISSVGQLTLQTVGLIENADKVFYVVSDPVTEAYIQSKNKNNVDLSMYYGNHKQRRETYVQQAEVSKTVWYEELPHSLMLPGYAKRGSRRPRRRWSLLRPSRCLCLAFFQGYGHRS